MKILLKLLSVALFLYASTLFAQNIEITKATNEFRYLKGSIVAITDTNTPLEDGYLSCLYIGYIHIGSHSAIADSLYGKPSQIIERSNGKRIKVYQIITPQNKVTFFATTVLNDTVIAIQLAGFPNEVFSFSSIHLGDTEKELKKTLGPPSKKEKEPDIDGFLWSYSPFPFSFEIVNNKVYSIKIWKP